MSFFSLFDISLDTANRLYTWGWKASLCGAAITLVGVSLLMWGTRVRDHDFESSVGQLNIDAGKANERAARLESEAAETKRKTVELERGNLELQSILERERIARLQLEAKYGPRRMAAAEQTALISALKRGFRNVLIFRVDDLEADHFAQDIAKALSASGIATEIGSLGTTIPSRYGVTIYDPNGTAGQFANAMRAAAPTLGIESKSPSPDTQKPVILIWLKPFPLN